MFMVCMYCFWYLFIRASPALSLQRSCRRGQGRGNRGEGRAREGREGVGRAGESRAREGRAGESRTREGRASKAR